MNTLLLLVLLLYTPLFFIYFAIRKSINTSDVCVHTIISMHATECQIEITASPGGKQFVIFLKCYTKTNFVKNLENNYCFPAPPPTYYEDEPPLFYNIFTTHLRNHYYLLLFYSIRNCCHY